MRLQQQGATKTSVFHQWRLWFLGNCTPVTL